MKYNVIDSIWFNQIGIVRVRPDHGEDKFYIGVGNGYDQKADEQKIASWGVPYYPNSISDFVERKI